MSMEAAVLSHQATERAHIFDVGDFPLIAGGARPELLTEAGRGACGVRGDVHRALPMVPGAPASNSVSSR